MANPEKGEQSEEATKKEIENYFREPEYGRLVISDDPEDVESVRIEEEIEARLKKNSNDFFSIVRSQVKGVQDACAYDKVMEGIKWYEDPAQQRHYGEVEANKEIAGLRRMAEYMEQFRPKQEKPETSPPEKAVLDIATSSKGRRGKSPVEVPVVPEGQVKPEQEKEISVEDKLKEYKEGQDVGVGMLGDDKVRVYDTLKWKFAEVVTDSRSGKDEKVVVVENEQGGKIRIPADIFLKMQEERPKPEQPKPTQAESDEVKKAFGAAGRKLVDAIDGVKRSGATQQKQAENPQKPPRVEAPPEQPVEQQEAENVARPTRGRKRGSPNPAPSSKTTGPVNAEQNPAESKPEAPPTPPNINPEDVERTTQESRRRKAAEKAKKTREERRAVETAMENPLGQYEQEAQERMYSRHVEQAEIEKPLRESVKALLGRDADKKREEFLLKWFEDHKNEPEFKALGDLSDIQKMKYAKDHGAWTKLITETHKVGDKYVKRYEKEFIEIRKLDALKLDFDPAFNEKDVPIDSQILALKYLEVKSKEIRKKIEEAKAVKQDTTVLENELDEVFQMRKGLGEKVLGVGNIEEAAEKELAGDPEYRKTKDQFVDDNSKENGWPYSDAMNLEAESVKKQVFGENHSPLDTHYALELIKLKTNADITEEQLCGLLKAGYDPRSIEDDNWKIARTAIKDTVKNFWNLGIIPLVKYSRGGGLVSVNVGGKEELMMCDEFLKRAHKLGEDFKADVFEKTKQGLGEKWEKDHKTKREEKVEEILSRATKNVEKFIEEKYEALRERWSKKAEKMEPKKKSAREKKKIDDEFGGRKKPNKAEKTKTISETLSELSADAIKDDEDKRGGGLKKLTGEFDDDAELLSDYFSKNLGVEGMTPKKLQKFVNKDTYKIKFGQRYGLFNWFVDILKDRPWLKK